MLVFDQIVPANRQPPFLAGSHLRPLFSAVGQMGFKSLPPEATLRDRPPQAGAAHLIRRICIAAQGCMHFDASPSLISGAKVG